MINAFLEKNVWPTFLLFLTLLVGTILPSLALVGLHRQKPIPEQASAWIQENIPAGSSIGILRADGVYWWTPSIIYESATHPERLKNPYHVIALGFSVSRTEQSKPDYILASGPERMNEAHRVPEGRDFLKWLEAGKTYRPVKDFSRDLHVGSWRWNRPELPLYADDDLWAPTIQIYQRLPAKT